MLAMTRPPDPVSEKRAALWDELENFGDVEGMFARARSPARLKALAKESLASQLKVMALADAYALEVLDEVDQQVFQLRLLWQGTPVLLTEAAFDVLDAGLAALRGRLAGPQEHGEGAEPGC